MVCDHGLHTVRWEIKYIPSFSTSTISVTVHVNNGSVVIPVPNNGTEFEFDLHPTYYPGVLTLVGCESLICI